MLVVSHIQTRGGRLEAPVDWAAHGRRGCLNPMPIRRDLRFFYPIDWRELSRAIRFGRAKGCCEGCGRPHGQRVIHLGDGRWWDEDRQRWRCGQGRVVRCRAAPVEHGPPGRTTRVVLATAHRDHDPGNNDPGNLAALCDVLDRDDDDRTAL